MIYPITIVKYFSRDLNNTCKIPSAFYNVFSMDGVRSLYFYCFILIYDVFFSSLPSTSHTI
jgi:hypothetical protein